MSDNFEFNDKKYYNKEYRDAMLALQIGLPIVGIRTAVIITLMDFIDSKPEYKDVPLEINATGITTIAECTQLY